MIDLDEATRRALLAREGPPIGARTEVLASLRARLGGPGDPGEPGDLDGGSGGSGMSDGGGLTASVGAGRAAWIAKIVGATVGLTTAGVLALGVGAAAIGALAGGDSAAPEQPTITATADELTVTGAELAEPSPPASTTSAERSGRLEASASARPRAHPSTILAEDEADSQLAAELALVSAAKRQRAGDPAAALASLERHRERFPLGVLAPEREALRVEVLCALGRPDEAAGAKAQFLREHGDSPLRARVIAACESGTDSSGAGD